MIILTTNITITRIRTFLTNMANNYFDKDNISSSYSSSPLSPTEKGCLK